MALMGSSILTSGRRTRQHGAVLAPATRRELERSGWRTTLDYRENHVRGLDGRLLRVEPVWTAEAEKFDGDVVVANASATSSETAWEILLERIGASEVTRRQRVRVAPIR
jgi:hypothetical protein